MDNRVVPKFGKARPVHYAVRINAEEELQQLVEAGILNEPIHYADWAAPNVHVLKKDLENVLVCSDFKLTMNKVTCLTLSNSWSGGHGNAFRWKTVHYSRQKPIVPGVTVG